MKFFSLYLFVTVTLGLPVSAFAQPEGEDIVIENERFYVAILVQKILQFPDNFINGVIPDIVELAFSGL